MATNPKKITLFNKVTKQQLETLAGGTSITKGSDTLTPQEGVGYLIPDTSVSYEAQTLSSSEKTQARTNIGAGTSNFSGSYNDLTDKPTIPTTTDTVTQGSTDALTSGGAYTAINNAISSVYKIQGSETVSNLNSATKTESMNGYVYNISTGGTLNNQDASTLTVVAGDNVLFVWASGSWYWDKLAGDIDLSGYLQKITSSGSKRVYAITENGSQTTTILDYANNATVNAIPVRALNGAIQIPDASYNNPGSITDGLQAINKNNLIQRTTALTGSGAPTTSTVGFIGQLYHDTTNNNIYNCTAITTVSDVTTYTWKKLLTEDNGLPYLTTAPSSANTDGLKLVVLSSEPATKYAGYFYIITE